MADSKPFTGRPRNRRTRWSVRLANRAASLLITVGGIATIAAITGIFFYLLVTVWPLFQPTSIEEPRLVKALDKAGSPEVLRVSESRALAWVLVDSGELTVMRAESGDILASTNVVAEGGELTAIASAIEGNQITLGYVDGSVQLGEIRFDAEFINPLDAEFEQFQDLKTGDEVVDGEAVVIRTPQRQLRRETVVSDFTADPMELSPGEAILRVDQLDTDAGPVVLAWSADNRARLVTVGEREDLFTGEVLLEPGQSAELPLESAPEGTPIFVGLGPRGASATLVWENGETLRFDTRDLNEVRLIERTTVQTGKTPITAASWMAGRLTLLVGNAEGRVDAWFPVRGDGRQAGVPDSQLELGHVFEGTGSAVTRIFASSRSRVAAMAHLDGSLQLVQVTIESDLGSTRFTGGGAGGFAPALFIPPNEDTEAIYAATGEGLYAVPASIGFSEANIKAYFRPIRYESYPAPRHVWQTSSATSATEPKLGMMPLIFGTLKATFYSMMFGVPVALLAAIYTSEFLSSGARGRIKPVVEVMASLPSVVLGFLAAIVFAPIVERWLAEVIASLITVPLVLLFVSRLWQASPRSTRSSWGRMRLPMAGLAIFAGAILAIVVAGPMEVLLFAGDLKRWLNGQVGSGFAAWLLLTVPVAVIASTLLSSRVINPKVLAGAHRWTFGQFVALDLARFVVTVIAVVGVASLFAWIFTAIGWDPRGEIVGTYVQRNAMVVGIVMGFAIIPLIYTLADDALNAVPEALRSASLGSGATHWQTAVWVVVPAAMSGLFSAMMVGLGRAVGETMIVLMAAGNMPIMEINIFSGFQTLSAAIATEMPEAVRGSTHFRSLFFAALVLFGLTFVVNTIAELVRIRFRRRMVQL